MKIKIVQNLDHIDVIPVVPDVHHASYCENRELYINGDRCPPGFEEVFFTGLDALSLVYIDALDRMMKNEIDTSWEKPE